MGHALEPVFLLPEHYHAFGRIVQAFVAVEDYYTGIISNLTGTEGGNTFFLLSNTGYEGVHKIIKTVVSGLIISDELKKEGLAALDRVHNHNEARNNVAHNSWTSGRRQKSIKPVVLRATGRLIAKGHQHNERDWTAEELEAEADAILEDADAFGTFLIKIGAYIAK